MAREVSKRAAVRGWLGLHTNMDPHDVPLGGSVVQNNLQCLVPGQAQVRGGLRLVTFTPSESAETDEIIAIAPYRTQYGDAVVYFTTAGDIKIGRSPSV